MASTSRQKIILLSTGTKKNGKPSKYFYTTYKNKRNTAGKLKIKKFDPWAWNASTQKLGMHILFQETKVPK